MEAIRVWMMGSLSTFARSYWRETVIARSPESYPEKPVQTLDQVDDKFNSQLKEIAAREGYEIVSPLKDGHTDFVVRTDGSSKGYDCTMIVGKRNIVTEVKPRK